MIHICAIVCNDEIDIRVKPKKERKESKSQPN